MKNENQPINPTNVQQVGNEVFRPIRDNDPKEHNVSFLGLTKREYFAGLAMQGLCAGRTEYENPMCDVKRAVELADLLLKELDKPISTTED